MATYNDQGVSPSGYTATAAITTPFRLVKASTTADKEIVISTGATDAHLGILAEAVKVGGLAVIRDFGTARGTASGTITRGDKLMFATGAKLATAVGAVTVCGVALQSCADGEVFEFKCSFPAVSLGA